MFRVVNELTREPVEDLCFRVLAEGRAINLANNSSLIAKDGREVPIEDSAAPILDTAGRVAGAVLVFHDVTAKREAQRALRASEERLRRSQEIAHLGSWELDLTSNRLSWSDEVYRLFGLTPGEFGATYEAFLDAVHPDDRAAVDAAYSGSLKEGRDQYEIEHRIVRQDTGEIRVVLEKCEHKRDASGRVIRSIGMVHDITEAKKAEILRQALADQERLRLGAAVEQASDSVVMVDLDGQIQYVNVAFESIYKTARDQAVGHSYFDHLAGKSPLLPAIREAIALGRPWHGHLSGSIAGGRPIELEVTISPAADPSGKVIGGLITEKDVTQENALQRQVRQSQKMEALGTLAGGITHDFNNILSTIFINTELAMLDLDLANPARRSLPIVLQAANRGRELVKQIITFSRQREWERKPLEVTPIVKEGVKFLRSTLPKDLAIHESIAPECGHVLADPSQVHQILINLCQNAALAMTDRAGQMEVKLEPIQVDATQAARHPDLKPGPYVRLTVADNGCGMTTQLMERIFEPFFTTRNHGEGSGLGLAVVHGIVKSYEGAITVYSEPGKGSVFSVYIPRLEGEAIDRGKGQTGPARDGPGAYPSRRGRGGPAQGDDARPRTARLPGDGQADRAHGPDGVQEEARRLRPRDHGPDHAPDDGDRAGQGLGQGPPGYPHHSLHRFQREGRRGDGRPGRDQVLCHETIQPSRRSPNTSGRRSRKTAAASSLGAARPHRQPPGASRRPQKDLT